MCQGPQFLDAQHTCSLLPLPEQHCQLLRRSDQLALASCSSLLGLPSKVPLPVAWLSRSPLQGLLPAFEDVFVIRSWLSKFSLQDTLLLAWLCRSAALVPARHLADPPWLSKSGSASSSPRLSYQTWLSRSPACLFPCRSRS